HAQRLEDARARVQLLANDSPWLNGQDRGRRCARILRGRSIDREDRCVGDRVRFLKRCLNLEVLLGKSLFDRYLRLDRRKPRRAAEQLDDNVAIQRRSVNRNGSRSSGTAYDGIRG